jgi:hypothetical protein
MTVDTAGAEAPAAREAAQPAAELVPEPVAEFIGPPLPETAPSPAARPQKHWREWLQFAALALILLLLSEALWLWQTWPVRDLLQPAAPTGARPDAR